MKNFLLSIGVIGLLVGAIVPAISGNTTYAVARFGDDDDKKNEKCSAAFLTFPAWYRGLPREGCDIKPPANGNDTTLTGFIFTIVVNIIEIGLQLVAYAAVGYVIYGGFKYLTAAGDPSRITAGRKIITNALIGLVLSFMSIAIVNLIANGIG